MSEELKQCPFCGDLMLIKRYGYMYGATTTVMSLAYYEIECKACNLTMRNVYSEENIRKAWNRRVNDYRGVVKCSTKGCDNLINWDYCGRCKRQ